MLIGVTAASIENVVNAPMILSNRAGLVDGVEYQAHMIADHQYQGVLESIFGLMGLDLALPEHSTRSRRLG